MVDTLSLSICKSFVERCLEFLSQYGHLAEAHMVDFIVDDLLATLVPEDMRVDFLADDDDVWFAVSSTHGQSQDIIGSSGSLVEFIHCATNCRLEVLLGSRMHLLDDLLENLRKQLSTTSSTEKKLQFDAYASHKKQHEVEIMADLVVAICQKYTINQVVDIGSGKGYLSSFLALQHNLNVLGIDSSYSNVVNASKRNARLKKSWDGLVERATTRAQKRKPEKRNKRVTNHDSQATDVSIRASGSFVGIFKWMDETTDLEALLVENVETTTTDNGEPFVLTGLHTCGNLAARVLESYVKEPRCRSVVSVGCCYHLVDEEFCNSPYTTELTGKSGFPMSSFLKEKRFVLGRNARMLACEALHRIIFQQSTPSITLFYRALLKAILRDKYGKRFDDVNVGRLAKKKVTDVKDYVRRAMLKIKAPEQLSDSEILSYLNKYSHYEKQMKHFCRLRSLLAPAIESVILLDRLCYLHEQDDVSSSYLVRLFDPVISPRCHAIISFKS